MTTPTPERRVPTRVRRFDEAVDRFGSLAERYADAMWDGDPLADAVVADFPTLGHGRGMGMVATALTDGIDSVDDAPTAIQALFAELDTAPPWLDLDRVDRGAAAYSRHAPQVATALGAASLVSGYSNGASVRPLALTGRFIDRAAVRAYETSTWLFATVRPEGLHRFGAGFERTVRVRMIHALVRAHVAAMPDWDADELGLPVPQADLAFGVVEFSWVPLRAMRRLGVRYTAEELGDIYHLWRYVGHLLGVDEDLVCADAASAERFYDLYHLVSPPPDDYCRQLVHALMDDVLVPQIEGALGPARQLVPTRDMLHGLSRCFVGDRVADGLGLTRTPWRHLPAVTGPVTALAYAGADLIPGAKRRRLEKALEVIDVESARFAERLGVSHDLVDRADDSRHPALPTP